MSMVVDMPRTRWTKSRVFRLGFWVGRGLKAPEIAELLESTPHTIQTVTNNMGGAFSDVPRGNLMIDLGRAIIVLTVQASRRGLTIERFVVRVLQILADDPTLLANVLDDGV